MLAETDFVIRLALAAFLGGLIGLERETHDRPAGLRTHILVSMGAALFTMTSFTFEGPVMSPTNLMANIVVGIGFIGAGAIFKDEHRVKGLTTAADLWVIASIGLLSGLGLYLFAAIAGLMSYVVLILGRKIKERMPHIQNDPDS